MELYKYLYNMRVCKYYSKSTYDFLNNYNYYQHKEINTYVV